MSGTNQIAVVVSHTEGAQELIDKIRALRDTVPNLIIPPSPTANQRLTSAATVSPDFVELTVTTTKNSPDLTRGGATDPDQVRDLLNYAEAYGAVAAELQAFLKFLNHSVWVAKNKAGRHALATYSLAKRLAKEPETSYLAPAAEAMRHKLGKRGRNKSQAEPAPGTPPANPPAPK